MFNLQSSIFNPLPDLQDMPDYKNLSPEEQEKVRNKTLLYGCGAYALAIVAVFAALALFSGCTAPRAVYEQQHHHYEADMLAVQAAVDSRMNAWHAENEAWFRQLLTEERSEWSSHEDQRETINETITVSLDSIGRAIRTEQRTISRVMASSQWSMINQVTREYEARLSAVVDSVNADWSQRYEAMQARVAQLDSIITVKAPVGDARPWYQRWWDTIRIAVIVLVLAALVWFLRRLWLPILKNP